MPKNINFIAWIALAAAIVAWGEVAFFAATIQADAASHSARVKVLSASSTLNSRTSALQALVSATASDRTELSTVAAVDPASLADTITNAGKSAGVDISITDANSVNAPAVAGAPPTQAFTFMANTAGSFASVMYAASLLESLPAPSSIQQIQLISSAGTPGAPAGKPSWQMNVEIKVVTASGISS